MLLDHLQSLSDALLFVVLMYNFKKHLERFWVIFTEERANNNPTKTSVRVVPLHLLLSKLDPKVIDQLPAGHALTGCDNVAKKNKEGASPYIK